MKSAASFLSLLFPLILTVPLDGQQAPSSTKDQWSEAVTHLNTLPALVSSEQTHGQIGFYGVPRDRNILMIDLGRDVTPEEIVLFPARLPTDLTGADGSNGFPPGLEVEIADEEDFSGAIRLGRWIEESPESGTVLPFLRLPGNGASGRYLRVSIFGSRLRNTGRGRFFTLGEIVVLEKGNNAALHRPVAATDSIENGPRWQLSNLTDGYLWCLPFAGKSESASNGYHSLIETSGTTSAKWVEVDLSEDYPIDEIHLVAAHPRDFADTAGFGFPPRFRVTGRTGDGTEIAIFHSGDLAFPNPGAATVMIPGNGTAVRHLRLETGELWRRTDDYIFALAELQAWSAGENVALGKPVAATDSTASGLWSTDALTDGFSSRQELLTWTTWLDAISKRERLQSQVDELTAILAAAHEASLRRWLYGAAALVVLVALGAIIVILAQQQRAALAEEELKRRIAGDLHDELGASLSHLALQSDLARSRIAVDDPVAARLTSLSESARETLDNMRDMVWLLAPVGGSWADLEARLENISERILDGVEHHFESDGQTPPGNPPIEWAREIVLFLKESLTNARKHAAPKIVSVHLRWSRLKLKLEVADDGRGFDSGAGEKGRGRGLLNFQTRAKALNGICRVESSPGSGTTITLEIPLPRL